MYIFRYTVEGFFGTIIKEIKARNEEEAKALFNAFIQDQCSMGIMATPK